MREGGRRRKNSAGTRSGCALESSESAGPVSPATGNVRRMFTHGEVHDADLCDSLQVDRAGREGHEERPRAVRGSQVTHRIHGRESAGRLRHDGRVRRRRRDDCPGYYLEGQRQEGDDEGFHRKRSRPQLPIGAGSTRTVPHRACCECRAGGIRLRCTRTPSRASRPSAAEKPDRDHPVSWHDAGTADPCPPAVPRRFNAWQLAHPFVESKNRVSPRSICAATAACSNNNVNQNIPERSFQPPVGSSVRQQPLSNGDSPPSAVERCSSSAGRTPDRSVAAPLLDPRNPACGIFPRP